jgi:hypothetical protein
MTHSAILLAISLLSACSGGPSEPPAATAEQLLPEIVKGIGDGSLVLASSNVDDDALADILADERVPALRSVTLTDNRVGPGGAAALAGSGKVSELTWLNLAQNRIGDAGFEALAGAEALSSLEKLFLAGNGATAVGAKALAASPHLAGVSYLSVGDQPLGDEGAQALLAMKALKRLELPGAGIGGAGARALIAGTAASALSLEGNPVGPGGLVGLEGFAPGLTYLSLKGTGLGLEDLAALGALESAGDLKELVLEDIPFGDAGVAAVGQWPWIKSLDKLYIEGSGCGKEARAQMRKDWGVRGGLKIEPR